ncbi:MAG: aminodeoxychorismate synthase component I [Capsulimonadaceae bacterium]
MWLRMVEAMPYCKALDLYAEFSFRHDRGMVETVAFARPTRLIVAERVEDVEDALSSVDKAVKGGAYAAGYVAYEAASAFDPAMVTHSGAAVPLVLFGIFDTPLGSPVPRSSGEYSVSGWSPSVSRERYSRDVNGIREAIARGDVYQVNYALQFTASIEGDDLAYFDRLCAAQGLGYHAYLNLGRYRILSVSPELFFRRAGNRVVTRPMKGTIARGRWSEEDHARKTALAASEKDRAENVMIVDLLRNDLGRLATPRTVAVDNLFQIEAYRTVYQMTSEISATVPSSTTLTDLFRALFPCGSITGAPKISATRLITALESRQRNVYCGAIGYVAPGGDARFNVAIRTVLVDTEHGTADYGSGGGITWDSAPDTEYEEAIVKMAVLGEEWPDFGLLETILLDEGSYSLLDRHMQRLHASAEYFDIPVDIADVRQELSAYASACGSGAWRVRVVVSKDGAVTVEGRPLPPTPSPVVVAVAGSPVDSTNRFLYHKTTNRKTYERHMSEHSGIFDVLLWNERRELTEFTMGNVVVEIDGVRWTPPLSSGLLPGTLRAELLDAGEIHERALTFADIERAFHMWFINSVRGWVPVDLRAPEGRHRFRDRSR